MKEIRKSLGVCPQTNCLFGTLTVREHLELYAALKGVKTADIEDEVEQKIREVGLDTKADIYSSALSGGMQRKLQCAMAFIGGSKVVFLDESEQTHQEPKQTPTNAQPTRHKHCKTMCVI